MKLLIVIWLNIVVVLAAVFAFVYIQQPVQTQVNTKTQTPTTNTPVQVTEVPTFKPREQTRTVQTPIPTNFGIPKNPTNPLRNLYIPTNKTVATQTQKTQPKPAVVENTPTAKQDIAASATKIRKALVNIICTSSASGSPRYISGSGIVIDPRGIILTNAHIAQYFLLKNYPTKNSTSCTVRTGSPARDAYKAKLMFISPAWISENSTILKQAQPTGTGEHDIALLFISKSAVQKTLPTAFQYVPLATYQPKKGIPVVIGSYAAQFLSVSEIQSSLYPTIVYAAVRDVFTFVSNTIDLISLGGTAAAQEGSSGGGIVDSYGNLVGTITTSTVKGATQTRNLNAITTTYIRRDYAQEESQSFDSMLAKSPNENIIEFSQKKQQLETLLTQALSAS